MEEAATVPAETSLDSGSISQDRDESNHSDDQQRRGEVRMISPKVADLEENVLKRANGRFGCELGWIRHDSSKCFED